MKNTGKPSSIRIARDTRRKMGDFLKLQLNSGRLNKLTETYIVSNNKIITAINKPLPLSAKEGLLKTLNTFNTNAK